MDGQATGKHFNTFSSTMGGWYGEAWVRMVGVEDCHPSFVLFVHIKVYDVGKVMKKTHIWLGIRTQDLPNAKRTRNALGHAACICQYLFDGLYMAEQIHLKSSQKQVFYQHF
jgi:hypothetical protein